MRNDILYSQYLIPEKEDEDDDDDEQEIKEKEVHYIISEYFLITNVLSRLTKMSSLRIQSRSQTKRPWLVRKRKKEKSQFRS